MRALLVVIHGILTRQTEASWPDHFDAWLARRDPECRVLKKEYRAGPFPRWNNWIKNRQLARGLAAEIELFRSRPASENPVPEGALSSNSLPPTWFIAHSNGAVIALLATQRLIARGCWVGGLILTGAACEADLDRNGILHWVRSGRVGAAIAYGSAEDHVLAGDPRAMPSFGSKLRQWAWRKLLWPYGCLGRTGWTWPGHTPRRSIANPEDPAKLCPTPFPNISMRWFSGGHSSYFDPSNRIATFELFYHDVLATSPQVPAVPPSFLTQP